MYTDSIPADALSYLDMNLQKGGFYGQIVAIRRRVVEVTGEYTIYVSYDDLATKFIRTSGSFVEKPAISSVPDFYRG